MNGGSVIHIKFIPLLVIKCIIFTKNKLKLVRNRKNNLKWLRVHVTHNKWF